MVCTCGHYDEDHVEIDGNFEGLVLGECRECICNEFCKDGDESEEE